MEVYDQNMCRICLTERSDDFESIFINDDSKEEPSDLGVLYQDILHLLIIPTENHPQYICNYCSLQLKLFHKFKMKAIESHKKFTSYDGYCKEESAEDISDPECDTSDNTSNYIKIEEMTVLDESEFDNEGFEEVQYLDEEIDSLESDLSTGKESPTTITLKCKDCKEVFEKRNQLRHHRRIIHPRIEYQCNLCPKRFYSKESHSVHMKVHNGLPAYQCEECNKTFNQKAHYCYHIMNHRNERNVQCHLCGKAFLNKSDLRIHLRVHNDERRYGCDICGKRFRAHTHMTNHRHSHFDKLDCEFCSQKYSSPSTLKTHIKSVHNGECPYECEFCNKKFKRKHHLKSHYKTHSKKTNCSNPEFLITKISQ